MKILLDNNTPAPLARSLRGHEVLRTGELGWQSFENGFLLNAAEDEGLDVLVTCDQNIPLQQNLDHRHIAVVILSTNHWPTMRPVAARIATKSTLLRVGKSCGSMLPSSRFSWPIFLVRAMINIRKLAALDIVLHGSKVILAEFVVAVSLAVGLGALSIIRGRALWQMELGVYLLFAGLNYVPLLIYVGIFMINGTAESEVASSESVSKYSKQSLLLLVPLVVPVVAIMQLRKTSAG